MAEENITAAAQTEAPAAEAAPGTAAAPTTEPAPPPEPPEPAQPDPKPAQPDPKPEPGAKPAEEAPKATSETTEKSPEVALLEGKVHALSAGVKPEMVDDVLTLAKANVKEGVTLEQAIDGVLERYSIFKGAAPPTITSSVPTGNDEAKASDDEFVNRIMGIK